MAIFYHGQSALFDHFDISHLFEGDGKCKFGVGEKPFNFVHRLIVQGIYIPRTAAAFPVT